MITGEGCGVARAHSWPCVVCQGLSAARAALAQAQCAEQAAIVKMEELQNEVAQKQVQWNLECVTS